MDEKRKKELEDIMSGMWQNMGSRGEESEDSIPVEEALEDRLALARRIGRLYLSFARVMIDRLGEEEGEKAILEAIRDYSLHCAEARKKGMVDLPRRGIHTKMELVEVEGEKRLRCHGCGVARELADQNQEKLGALYCYVDPCSYLLTTPNIKMYHTKMEPLGDDYCEFNLAIITDREMDSVLEPGRDFRDLDPIIKKGTKGPLT